MISSRSMSGRAERPGPALMLAGVLGPAVACTRVSNQAAHFAPGRAGERSLRWLVSLPFVQFFYLVFSKASGLLRDWLDNDLGFQNVQLLDLDQQRAPFLTALGPWPWVAGAGPDSAARDCRHAVLFGGLHGRTCVCVGRKRSASAVGERSHGGTFAASTGRKKTRDQSWRKLRAARCERIGRNREMLALRPLIEDFDRKGRSGSSSWLTGMRLGKKIRPLGGFGGRCEKLV